eukprot:9440915-Ditylum_brightwellii.AAC.2
MAEEYESLTQPQKDELCERCINSKWGQLRKTQGQGKGQGSSGRHSSKHKNYKQRTSIASAVYKNMRFLSKKKRVDAAEDSSKAYIMSLFRDKAIKKATRASILSAEAIKIGSPAKDAVKEALSMPYVAPKRQLSPSEVLQ